LEHGCGLRLYRRRFLAGDPLALNPLIPLY
jgi:hypothetical protein